MKKFKVFAVTTLTIASITSIAIALTNDRYADTSTPTTTTDPSSTTQQTAAVEVGTKTTPDGLFRYNVVSTIGSKYIVITQYLGKAQVVNIPITIEGYNVERIGNNAFNSNTTIKSVKIPQIKTLGTGIFSGCTSLQEVTISENVREIGADSFKGCPINKITVSKLGIYNSDQVSLTTLTDWTNVVNRMAGLNVANVQGKYFMYNDKYIKNLLTNYSYIIENGGITIVRYTGTVSNLVVPETIDGLKVLKVGPEAFYGDRYLVSVILPKNVQTVDKNLFLNCTALKNITVSAETTATEGSQLITTPIETLTIDYGTADITNITSADVEQLVHDNYGIDDASVLFLGIVIKNNDGSVVINNY